MFAHPFWSTFHIARKKINSRTCANRYFGIILCDIFVNPFFLLWASQTGNQQIRVYIRNHLIDIWATSRAIYRKETQTTLYFLARSPLRAFLPSLCYGFLFHYRPIKQFFQ